MPLLEIESPSRNLIPDPIVATKVEREVQEAFDHLAKRTYRCTRAELLRACVLDCIKRHEEAKQKSRNG